MVKDISCKDISYEHYSKKNDIHGTVLYPATMVAPVQNEFLNVLMRREKIRSVFDPFCGSGTSLYEAMLIDDKVRLVGCDINPLAYLITETKLAGIDATSITHDIWKLKQNMAQLKGDGFTFTNIDKWFRGDIISDLRIIRSSIMKIENERNRKYFWCTFSDLIRRYSNTRSSTYKLHIKDRNQICNMVNNVKSDFLEAVNQNIAYFDKRAKTVELHKKDILSEISKFASNEFDLSITSPPYGENHTTVTYGQFSSLPLRWIDAKDLRLEGWELNNYSIIDRKSMGGSVKLIQSGTDKLGILNPYIANINSTKRRKVMLFFDDYFKFLDELCRVTSKYIVMTLGNRRVDNQPINLTEITSSYLESNGFVGEGKASRRIMNKRIPRVTSCVNNRSVASMNEEHVIVYRKGSG